MSGVPQSVLLIDDEVHIRLYLKLVLQELGVKEIHEASNGEEGVRKYLEIRPDVVLLDVNMPVMTGTEVLEALTKSDPEAAVVMMTGHASRHLIESCHALGAVHYIRKDTPRAEVQTLLRELFEELFGED
jgi:two-component system chemotaxis response regulator CheY